VTYILNCCFFGLLRFTDWLEIIESSIRCLSIFFKSLERYQFGRKNYIILKFE